MTDDREKNNQLVKAKTSSLQKRDSNIVSRGLSDLALLDVKEARSAFTCSYLLFFTDKGRMYSLKVYNTQPQENAAKGNAILNILNLTSNNKITCLPVNYNKYIKIIERVKTSNQKITAFLPVKEFTEGRFIVMATKYGLIKKVDLTAFANIRSGGLIAIGLRDEGDELISTRLTDGSKELFLGTMEGQAIRFNESQLRSMGKIAGGVRAIKLGKDDVVVAMEALEEGMTILTMTAMGYGKRTEIEEYHPNQRSGSGIINIKVTEKNGPVVGIDQVTDEEDITIATDIGKVIRIAVKDVPVISRHTQGVKLIDIENGERVTGFAPVTLEICKRF